MSPLSKTAVVTGASSGIGAVYADRLAARGYDLILVARRADRLKTLAEKLSMAHGTQVRVLVADLSKESDLADVEAVLRRDSNLHLLVNNAGIARMRPFAQSSAEDAVAQIAINVTAPTRLTNAVLPAMLARNEGAIINIASVLAVQALPVSAVYSATKAFVLQLSRGLQGELANTGVRVQAVLPAATATEIWSEESGVPLSALDQSTVMNVDDMVDAALVGFDRGEAITLPNLVDAGLWANFDTARLALFGAARGGKPAPRYTA